MTRFARFAGRFVGMMGSSFFHGRRAPSPWNGLPIHCLTGRGGWATNPRSAAAPAVQQTKVEIGLNRPDMRRTAPRGGRLVLGGRRTAPATNPLPPEVPSGAADTQWRATNP